MGSLHQSPFIQLAHQFQKAFEDHGSISGLLANMEGMYERVSAAFLTISIIPSTRTMLSYSMSRATEFVKHTTHGRLPLLAYL